MDDFIGLDEKQIARINRIREERAIKKIMGPEPPTTRFGEPIKKNAIMDEKLKKAMYDWYKEQDRNFEYYHRQNKNGEIVEIKSAFKELNDDLAKKYDLPKNWLKRAMDLDVQYP
jgi:hypothetical protein